MLDNFLEKIHSLDNMKGAIINGVMLDKESNKVIVKLSTDKIFTAADSSFVNAAARELVPRYFGCEVEISKLTPDTDMVKRKIHEAVKANFRALSVTLDENDISVEKTDEGYSYSIAVMPTLPVSGVCDSVNAYLKKNFCGEFNGRCVKSSKRADELETEEEHENIEFEIPIRRFRISGFDLLEGTEKIEEAVYMSDMNFESEKVSVCGVIEDIRERTYTNAKNQEKSYYVYTLSDTTAMFRVTYFTRQKSIDKIKALKVGDSIVCTGKSEMFKGYNIRFTANTIDYGTVPEGFVPEKRASKPVPEYYSFVTPQPFSDVSQTDMFTDTSVPACLRGETFVVFDLETTGLNSSPSSDSMDRIIEIGAYKVRDGVICEQFSTFINPQKKLSEEIINLTGITEEMVADAPTYEQVMPDFFKFCDGAILVGHNAAGFDFKFVDHYCACVGYMLERRIIDTLPLSQEILFLSNYKLNTVADKFGISFNHHRAVDDAYVTAKIFIELIKMKKSLPKLQ